MYAPSLDAEASHDFASKSNHDIFMHEASVAHGGGALHDLPAPVVHIQSTSLELIEAVAWLVPTWLRLMRMLMMTMIMTMTMMMMTMMMITRAKMHNISITRLSQQMLSFNLHFFKENLQDATRLVSKSHMYLFRCTKAIDFELE